MLRCQHYFVGKGSIFLETMRLKVSSNISRAVFVLAHIITEWTAHTSRLRGFSLCYISVGLLYVCTV